MMKIYKYITSAALIAAVCCTSGSVTGGRAIAGDSDTASSRTIAVMPFANQTSDKKIDWLGAGVADSLSSKLSAVENLVVVERAQISNVIREAELGMTGLMDETQAPKLGKMMGAKTMVLGSYAGVKSGGKLLLRFNCKIVEVETGRLIGGGGVRTDGVLDTIFDMEEKIAEGVASRVGIALSGAEKKYMSIPTCNSVTAYELYSLALNEPDSMRKKALLERALTYDQKFARAHLALGYVLYEISVMQGQSPELVQHLNAAMKIDPRLIESNYILGSYYDRVSGREDAEAGSKDMAVKYYNIYIEKAGNSALRTVEKRVERARQRIEKLSAD